MDIFQDVKLTWKGVEWLIPANKVLGAIASIESVVTLHELTQFEQRGTAPLARMAQAFARALRYAGCRVEDDEVYAAMFSNAEQHQTVAIAVATLLQMMVPTSIILEQSKTPVGKQHPIAAASSSKRTKPRSVKSGSHPINSGN